MVELVKVGFVRMETIRAEYPWLNDVLLFSGQEALWWTFAGGRANAALAHELATRLEAKVIWNNFAVRFSPRLQEAAIRTAMDGLWDLDARGFVAPASEQTIDGLKFSQCLSRDLALRVVQSRLDNTRCVAGVLGRATRTVVAR